MDDFNIVGFFCEYVREEVRGKTTLIGVYSDAVNVPKVPGAFAHLSIYVRLHLKRNYPVNDLALIFKPIQGDPVELGAFKPEDLALSEKIDEADPNPFVGVIMQGSLASLPIPAEGRMTVFVRLNGEEHLAAALKVRVRPPNSQTKTTSTVSSPPSSLSPSDAAKS